MNLTQKEQEVLNFVRKKQGEDEADTMECKIRAIQLLKSCGLGGDYVSVALCHGLTGKGKAGEEELLNLVGEEAYEAIKIFDKRENPNLGTNQYLEIVKENRLANVAMVATLACMLDMAVNATKEFQKELIYRAENYYLKFGLGSPGYLFIKEGYDSLKEGHASSTETGTRELMN